jgi:hypothetical protein
VADALQDSKSARVTAIMQHAIQLAEEAQETVDELVTLLKQYADRQEDNHE